MIQYIRPLLCTAMMTEGVAITARFPICIIGVLDLDEGFFSRDDEYTYYRLDDERREIKMMKLLKKNFPVLLAVVLCLSLTACFGSGGYDVEPDVGGTDWRTTGIWRTDGTIIRDGESIDVLVCVNSADATFYYDEDDQMVFDYVDYPITLEGDAGEMFQGIDFDDLNGDGNSDVTMWFNDGNDGMQMVWYWDADLVQFVYQWDASWLGEENEPDWDDSKTEYEDEPDAGSYSWDSELCQRNVSEFEGVWYYEGDLSATMYIIIDGNGNWSYYERMPGEAEGTEMDYGTFSYSADEVSTYYADSILYEGNSIRVFEFDEGVIIWGEDSYTRME